MASAARVIDTEVEALTGDAPSSIDVDVFIETAHTLVEEKLGDEGLSEALLTQIELYLAAHFLTLHPEMRILTEEDLGDARSKYAGDFGKFLEFTQWGQMVLVLDISGKMKETDKRKVIWEDLSP